MMDLHSRRGARAAKAPSALTNSPLTAGKRTLPTPSFARLFAQESRAASGFKPHLRSEENVPADDPRTGANGAD
jgi:hypothetical protein